MTDDPFARVAEAMSGSDVEADRPAPADDWRPIVPAPVDAPKITRALLDRCAPPGYVLKKVTPFWHSKANAFRDEDGDVVNFYVARYEDEAGRKSIRPFTFGNDVKGRPQWSPKAPPAPRPLLNAHRLQHFPAATILVVEGEKCVEAAQALFPAVSVVVVTSSGGANAAAMSDWSVVAGRAVVVWPDADGPGRRYAEDVVRLARAAGAASVRVVELPPGLPEAWDLADPVPEDMTIDPKVLVAGSAVADSGPTTAEKASTSWNAPDLSVLGSGRRPAPTFDVDVLGPVWTEWAVEQAAAASAPVDYVGAALLAAAGAAVANVRWPLAGANWSEPPLIWCGLVGSPSAGKSPAMTAAIDLVRAAEERMAEGFDDTRRLHETAKRVAEAAKEEWEIEIKIALKESRKAPPMPMTAEVPDEPVRPRLMTMDSSTEKLALLAAALPRGLLRTYDELAGWFGSFGRYGGSGADRAFAIEMYGGRHYTVDRVKTPDPIRIRHLSIGVLGGIQPEKLAEALESPDDGLPARFLWSWPDTLPTFTLSRERLSSTAAKSAFARLAELPMGSDEYGNPEPVRMRLDPVAEDLIEAFAREVAARAADASGVFAGTLGKARGHVLRLSAILELLWWSAQPDKPAPTSISAAAVGDAIDLVDSYFLPMAERVFGDSAIPIADRNATALARHLRQAREPTFNARLVRRSMGGALRDAAAMEAACTALVDAGIIRAITSLGMGRKPKDFEVNPAIFGGQ